MALINGQLVTSHQKCERNRHSSAPKSEESKDLSPGWILVRTPHSRAENALLFGIVDYRNWASDRQFVESLLLPACNDHTTVDAIPGKRSCAGLSILYLPTTIPRRLYRRCCTGCAGDNRACGQFRKSRLRPERYAEVGFCECGGHIDLRSGNCTRHGQP